MAKKHDGPRSVSEADVALGQRIRLLRAERDMSQTQLGDALGVSFQQVQKYEKGVNRVGATRLQQIAVALGVPYSHFYEGPTKDKGRPEVEFLLFKDSKFGLRLLRAYTAIGDLRVKRQFVALMERVAGIKEEEEK